MLRAPLKMTIVPSRRCPLACPHCSAKASNHKQESNWEKWKVIFDQLREAKVFSVNITGGEPFYYPQLCDLVELIFSKRMMLDQINTAGVRVKDSHIEFLSRGKKKPLIKVSLDGATAETDGLIRGAGHLEEACDAIRRFVAQDFPVCCSTTVMQQNQHGIEEMVSLAKRLGCRYINLSFYCEAGRAVKNRESISLSRDEKFTVLRQVGELRKKYGSFLQGPCWEQYVWLYEPSKVDFGSRAGYLFACGAGQSDCVLDADGSVYVCEMMLDFPLGNILQEGLQNVWRNAPLFKRIRQSRGIKLDLLSACSKCSRRYRCIGKCPAAGYNLTGRWPVIEPDHCIGFEEILE